MEVREMIGNVLENTTPEMKGKNGNMILQNNKLKRTEGIENNTVIEGE